MSRVTRVNGFQRPFSRDQVTSWVLQPTLIVGFVAITSAYLQSLTALWILIPYIVLVTAFGTFWVYCELRNPASPNPVAKWIVPVPPKPTRYCTNCSKNSPGLDHHCTWLNTCIGESNYEPFFLLILTGTAMVTYQAIVGILMATSWHDEIVQSWHPHANVAGSLAALWIHNIICLVLSVLYGSLTGFHVYLLYLRMGTYDFILKYGANNVCIRLLRCQCLSTRPNKPKEPKSPPTNDKDVATSVSISTERKGSKSLASVTHVSSSTMNGSSAAPSTHEVAEWKTDWLQKYGGGGSDDDSSAKEHEVARARKVSVSNIHVELGGARESMSSVAPLAASADDSTMDDVNLHE
ncbi:Aste57867_23108 [Aphanomyces stellatus]|uniref:Palmitoyltransferase n=1 Tax=Aphanomyces stellatus TaxID=120398 RepID=A0A485LNI2_9STRA|nr:hypothetical protein As57867_023037 [Aphanomyces stellatus]VFT99756.1 Aste57867_23108 [Aphanomyces stellatus]